ncbi:release factor glutamine methyltransferase [Variibacter gotjawalensis]|uniref:Release factor glutamine methyltransferase n=1 Tax=Variibacter gotjawalensis TaxID=1333996 RepID=A0A0S3PR91_9BRAD|nr:peptide chain release factor N(5)-glutamine methyltransferase [Variibacter gotjawalensis]NIK48787.1 release factor glutamine methyltransferase [Variibacter gotjawalensis]RZS50648.1 release factor glutamine methyltransferase [Variibacter gotjawalensis]BAT58481.1 release factor glutamine methyltransferase [Variibacter gotjawalensis]
MILSAGATVARAEQLLSQAFRDAGIDTAMLDARFLLQARLGVDRTGLLSDATRELTIIEAEALSRDAARRLARESVAVILGEQEFWSLPFRVTRDTLVPRPDTETLVEAALTAIADRASPIIADLGTGTGAILCSLLHERRDAFGVGVDISAAALDVARGNARRLNLATRARFIRASFTAALGNQRVDLVVSNPPYIGTAEIARLEPEVRHEPILALDGGADGLDAYRAIAVDVTRVLKPGAVVALEIGATQESAVAAVFAGHGLTLVRPAVRDLGGNPRALILQRN